MVDTDGDPSVTMMSAGTGGAVLREIVPKPDWSRAFAGLRSETIGIQFFIS